MTDTGISRQIKSDTKKWCDRNMEKNRDIERWRDRRPEKQRQRGSLRIGETMMKRD